MPKLGATLTEDKERKVFVSTVIRQDISPGSVGDQRRTKNRQSSGFREDEDEDVAGYAGEVQQQVGGFSVKEMISNECKVNDNVNKNSLLQNVLSLQIRVN